MYLSQTIHRKRALFKTKRFFLVFIQMVAKHNQAVAMISLDRVHIFDHMIFSSKVFMHQNYWVLNVIHLKISKKGIVRLSTKSFKWVVNQEIKGKLFTHDKNFYRLFANPTEKITMFNFSGKGIFYLQTNSKPIFGKGVNPILNAITTAKGDDFQVLKNLFKLVIDKYGKNILK